MGIQFHSCSCVLCPLTGTAGLLAALSGSCRLSTFIWHTTKFSQSLWQHQACSQAAWVQQTDLILPSIEKKNTLILLFLFRSLLWPESLKGNRNRKISPLYSTFCILLFSLLKFIVKEVTGKWVWVLFAFLKLKPKPFSHWAFSGDLSEAAVKTGTKGLQRKMEGKGSWSFSLLCSECGASFMSRGEVGRECVSEL